MIRASSSSVNIGGSLWFPIHPGGDERAYQAGKDGEEAVADAGEMDVITSTGQESSDEFIGLSGGRKWYALGQLAVLVN